MLLAVRVRLGPRSFENGESMDWAAEKVELDHFEITGLREELNDCNQPCLTVGFCALLVAAGKTCLRWLVNAWLLETPTIYKV